MASIAGCSAGEGPIDLFGDAARSDGGALDAGVAERDSGLCGSEVCDNGLDDDCDGRIDDDCNCIPGEMQGCYTGPVGVRGVGACTDGAQSCDDAVEFGAWGECVGSVLPAAEVCDAAGVDENCDGAVNEGCGCDPSMGPLACGEDEGACAPGTQECVDGMLGECAGAIGPSAETCNGIDDDCDARIDESSRARVESWSASAAWAPRRASTASGTCAPAGASPSPRRATRSTTTATEAPTKI
jgi:hypothetical protein